jgi:hypothetical protein
VTIVRPNVTMASDVMMTMVVAISPPMSNITSVGPIMPHVTPRTFIDYVVVCLWQVLHINHILWF